MSQVGVALSELQPAQAVHDRPPSYNRNILSTNPSAERSSVAFRLFSCCCALYAVSGLVSGTEDTTFRDARTTSTPWRDGARRTRRWRAREPSGARMGVRRRLNALALYCASAVDGKALESPQILVCSLLLHLVLSCHRLYVVRPSRSPPVSHRALAPTGSAQRLTMASTYPPSCSKTPSSSSLASKKFEGDPEKKDNAIVAEQDASKPAWQRIVAGDAKEGYDTQRALNTRHIMMIGASPGLSFKCCAADDDLEPSVGRSAPVSSSALALYVCFLIVSEFMLIMRAGCLVSRTS